MMEFLSADTLSGIITSCMDWAGSGCVVFVGMGFSFFRGIGDGGLSWSSGIVGVEA